MFSKRAFRASWHSRDSERHFNRCARFGMEPNEESPGDQLDSGSAADHDADQSHCIPADLSCRNSYWNAGSSTARIVVRCAQRGTLHRTLVNPCGVGWCAGNWISCEQSILGIISCGGLECNRCIDDEFSAAYGSKWFRARMAA